jgi:heme-degrading monooxygenase HmoA
MATKYTLTFSGKTAKYACHAVTCSAAHGNSKKDIHSFLGHMEWASVEATRAFANADESEKAGQPTRANWKACPCTRV